MVFLTSSQSTVIRQSPAAELGSDQDAEKSGRRRDRPMLSRKDRRAANGRGMGKRPVRVFDRCWQSSDALRCWVLSIVGACVVASGSAWAGTYTFTTVADTEVRSDIPTVNFGTATVMGLDGSPVRTAYLRFNVSVPPGEVVSNVTLKLFMTSGSSASVFANQVASTNWGETTTTYANAPAIGAQVAASGAFSANAYLSMDVTPAVTGSGLVSFAVTRTNTVALGFNSREAAGANRAELVVTTTPAGDTTAPLVSVSAPTPGSVVAGSAVTVSANASDNVGVAGVQFKLDGVNLGAEDTSAPYGIVWDTTGVANGPHTLTAVARDAANNTATAADVGVTVTNASTVFVPVADTEVRSDIPTVNFGTATVMGLSGSPVRRAYLRFNVSVPPGEVVSKVDAEAVHDVGFVGQRVCQSGGEHELGGDDDDLFECAGDWSAGCRVRVHSRANAYVSMDVTPAVTGSGLVSFAVTRTEHGAHRLQLQGSGCCQPASTRCGQTTPCRRHDSSLGLGERSGAWVCGCRICGDGLGQCFRQRWGGRRSVQAGWRNLGAEDTSAPYSIVWDTTGVANGPHTLAAVARDAANNTATAADVGVTVSNVTVALSAPAAGSMVTGTGVTVSATASANVTGVQFKLDGANLGAEDTSAPYSIVWDTTGVANGPHTLTAVARDAANNTATAADVGVTVSNLTAALSAPAAGSTVSGASVTVSADAGGPVAGVQFKLDGVNLGAEDTSTPYGIVWDTTGVANGPHTLTAVARDAANNTATAADVG